MAKEDGGIWGAVEVGGDEVFVSLGHDLEVGVSSVNQLFRAGGLKMKVGGCSYLSYETVHSGSEAEMC